MVDHDILSKREEQIAQRYVAGASYKEIAQALGIAPSTVRTHLATIYRKLEVSSKVELMNHLGGGAGERRSQTDLTSVVSELALTLEEALQRERALSEVLRIISTSQGDLEGVMHAVLGYALELCDAEFGVLFEYRQNQQFRTRFTQGLPTEFDIWLNERGTFTPGPQTALGRMGVLREVVNIFDIKAEAVFQTDDPLRHATSRLGGARSFVAIPMLSGDRLVGAFTIYRQTLRPFSEEALRVAHIFAAQSAIAWENARLISEARG